MTDVTKSGSDPFGNGDSSNGRDRNPVFGSECIKTLQRLVIGDRSASVMSHIDTCGICRRLVYGDGKLFKSSVFEDAAREQLIHQLESTKPGFVPASEEVGLEGVRRHLDGIETSGRELEKEVKIVQVRIEERNRPAVAEPLRHERTSPSDQSPCLPRLSRRRWMITAAATAAALALGGTAVLFQVKSEAHRVSNSANTGLPITPGRSRALSKWDGLYQGSNVVAVRTAMTRAPAAELPIAFEWVAERRVLALYSDLIGYLVDPNTEIRSAAIINLPRVPPIDLKPMLGGIQTARSLETLVGLQAPLDILIKNVVNA